MFLAMMPINSNFFTIFLYFFLSWKEKSSLVYIINCINNYYISIVSYVEYVQVQ